MTNESKQDAPEEQGNPQDAEKQRFTKLGKSSAEVWADQVKNMLESKKGEWVYEMDLEKVAPSPYSTSGWEYEGYSEGWEQGLKNKGIEKRQGTEEESGKGMGGNWYRVV